MTIQDLGSLGEVVAGIATVVTLAYLAVQIRSSAAATRAESRRSMDAVRFETMLRIAENPEFARLFNSGLSSAGSLPPEDFFRFNLALSLVFSLHETVWVEVQRGTMAPEELDNGYERLKLFALSPGGRVWWQERSGMYSSEFRDYLNSRLSSGM